VHVARGISTFVQSISEAGVRFEHSERITSVCSLSFICNVLGDRLIESGSIEGLPALDLGGKSGRSLTLYLVSWREAV